ncbi:MAG: hypothetical protein AAF223_04205 [Bacteroidota bacterium]
MNTLSSIQRLFLLALGLMVLYFLITRIPGLEQWLPATKWWKAALGILFGTITLIWYLRAHRSRHEP